MRTWISIGAIALWWCAQACALETTGKSNEIPQPDGGSASAPGDSGTDSGTGGYAYSSTQSLRYEAAGEVWESAGGAAGWAEAPY